MIPSADPLPKTSDVGPFRAWLAARPTVETARAIGVSGQTIRNWRSGASVPAARFYGVIKLEAAKSGVILTTDDLLPTGAS